MKDFFGLTMAYNGANLKLFVKYKMATIVSIKFQYCIIIGAQQFWLSEVVKGKYVSVFQAVVVAITVAAFKLFIREKRENWNSHLEF